MSLVSFAGGKTNFKELLLNVIRKSPANDDVNKESYSATLKDTDDIDEVFRVFQA